MKLEFEWDDEKAARNACDHDGVTFEQAAVAFRDKFAVEWIDERGDYGEERSVLLGMIGGQILYVAYTERGSNIRIISARRATRHEEEIYFRHNAG
ncbi:MAG TPA: BrnT family toxin [Nitrospira sp.]